MFLMMVGIDKGNSERSVKPVVSSNITNDSLEINKSHDRSLHQHLSFSSVAKPLNFLCSNSVSFNTFHVIQHTPPTPWYRDQNGDTTYVSALPPSTRTQEYDLRLHVRKQHHLNQQGFVVIHTPEESTPSHLQTNPLRGAGDLLSLYNFRLRNLRQYV